MMLITSQPACNAAEQASEETPQPSKTTHTSCVMSVHSTNLHMPEYKTDGTNNNEKDTGGAPTTRSCSEAPISTRNTYIAPAYHSQEGDSQGGIHIVGLALSLARGDWNCHSAAGGAWVVVILT